LLPGAVPTMTIHPDSYEFGAVGSRARIRPAQTAGPENNTSALAQKGVPKAVLRKLPTASMHEAKEVDCSICFNELKPLGVSWGESRFARRDANAPIFLSKLRDANAPIKLPCAHMYHKSCITRWLATHTGCPLCRRDVSCAAGSSSTTNAPRQRSSHAAAAATSLSAAGPAERSHRRSLTPSNVAPIRGNVRNPQCVSPIANVGGPPMRRSGDGVLHVVPQWCVSWGEFAEERADTAGRRLVGREPPRRRAGNGHRSISMPAVSH